VRSRQHLLQAGAGPSRVGIATTKGCMLVGAEAGVS